MKPRTTTPPLEETPGTGDAHTVALELLRQLITLSAGVLALSATFIGQFQSTSGCRLLVLFLAWALLASSVFFGLEAISAIVQSRLRNDEAWSKGEGRRYGLLSKYMFVAGLAAFALFALLTLADPVGRWVMPKHVGTKIATVHNVEVYALHQPSKTGRGKERLWITLRPEEGSAWRVGATLGFSRTPRIRFEKEPMVR